MNKKTIIWIFAVLLLSSFAIAITETNPEPPATPGPTTSTTGMSVKILPQYNLYLDNVTPYEGATDPSSCRLVDDTGALMFNATLVNDGSSPLFCNFTTPQLLTGGKQYNISAYRGGQSYTYAYTILVGSYPLAGTYLNWTGTFDGATSDTCCTRGIISLGFRLIPAGYLTTATVIKMNNPFDNSQINTFNVSIGNSSNHYIANTTNGSITFYNLTDNFQANITIPNFYESSKTVNFNATSITYTNTSIQAIFNVTAYEIITGTRLSGFNASLTYNNATTNVSLYLITDNNSRTVTGQKAGYFNTSVTGTATTGQINNISLLFGSSLFRINASDALTRFAVNNITLTITSLNYSYTTVLTNTTGNTITSLALKNMNYNLTLSATDYENISATLVVLDNSTVNYTFSLYNSNSFFMTFKDEVTKNIINNVTAELISDVFSSNYTTTNGTIYARLLMPSSYNIRYFSDGYNTRSYYATLSQQQAYSLTLFLLSNASSSLITFTVVDQANTPLQAVTIKALRYDITTNTYSVVEMSQTDINGQTTMNLQLYTEYYYFILEYGGEVILTTDVAYLISNTKTFQVNIGDAPFENAFTLNGIFYNLTTIEPATFKFEYNDYSNAVSGACLYVYVNDNLTKTLNQSSCTTSTSGNILITVINETGLNYEADAFIYYNSYYWYFGTLYLSFEEYFTTEPDRSILFYLFLFEILIISMSFFSVFMTAFLVPIPFILFEAVKFTSLGWEVISSVTAISWIIAYIVSDRG